MTTASQPITNHTNNQSNNRPRQPPSILQQSIDQLQVRLDAIFTAASHALYDETGVPRLLESLETATSLIDQLIIYLIEVDTYCSIEHAQPHQATLPIVLSSNPANYQPVIPAHNPALQHTHYSTLMKQQYERIEQLRAKYRLVVQVTQAFFNQSNNQTNSDAVANSQAINRSNSLPINQSPESNDLSQPLQRADSNQSISHSTNHSSNELISQPLSQPISSPVTELSQITPSRSPENDITMEIIE